MIYAFLFLLWGYKLDDDKVFVVSRGEEVSTADFYLKGNPKTELVASLKGRSIGIAGVVVLNRYLSEIDISMGHLLVRGPSHRLWVYCRLLDEWDGRG